MRSSFIAIAVFVLCVVVVGMHRIQTVPRAISLVPTSAAPGDAIRAWLVTVATFPVGLIVFALFPQRRVLTAVLRDADDGGRQVVFAGEASNHLANRLATIADQG